MPPVGLPTHVSLRHVIAHVTLSPRPSLLVFAYCKQSKTGQWWRPAWELLLACWEKSVNEITLKWEPIVWSTILKIEYSVTCLATIANVSQHAQAVNSNHFQLYVVTRSYSSHLFLCALVLIIQAVGFVQIRLHAHKQLQKVWHYTSVHNSQESTFKSLRSRVYVLHVHTLYNCTSLIPRLFLHWSGNETTTVCVL